MVRLQLLKTPLQAGVILVSIPLWFDYNGCTLECIQDHFQKSQFHYGSITTDALLSASKTTFRSLNSTMVRLQLEKILKELTIYLLSQFHYGSITTYQFLVARIKFLLVSIPLWFDYNTYSLQRERISLTVSIPLWFDYNKRIPRKL